MNRPPVLEIVAAGLATTIQDAGRPGFAELGVTRAGFVDRILAAAVNRSVGNPAGGAAFETAGGLRVRALSPCVVMTDHLIGPTVLRAGEELEVPTGRRRWHYLAVRGTVDVSPVLGSASYDTIGRIGPPPPVAGDRYGVGPEPLDQPVHDVIPLRSPPERHRLAPGPREDWISGGVAAVAGGDWEVGEVSRVGMRLRGRPLRRTVADELASEGLVPGAIQIPPDGQPVVMLADHPTTGGYPVVAVVHPDDLAALAQRLSGTVVRFRA